MGEHHVSTAHQRPLTGRHVYMRQDGNISPSFLLYQNPLAPNGPKGLGRIMETPLPGPGPIKGRGWAEKVGHLGTIKGGLSSPFIGIEYPIHFHSRRIRTPSYLLQPLVYYTND